MGEWELLRARDGWGGGRGGYKAAEIKTNNNYAISILNAHMFIFVLALPFMSDSRGFFVSSLFQLKRMWLSLIVHHESAFCSLSDWASLCFCQLFVIIIMCTLLPNPNSCMFMLKTGRWGPAPLPPAGQDPQKSSLDFPLCVLVCRKIASHWKIWVF